MSPELLLASWVVGALAAVILSSVAAFIIWTEACLRFLEWALTLLPARARDGLLHQLRTGSAGLHAIARPKLLMPIFLLSLLQWFAVIGCVAFSIKSVDVPLSLTAAVSVLLLNVIGLTLPTAPGHVGTVQLSFTVALVPFGVGHSEAFAASVIYNFVMVAMAFALGVPSFRKTGMELRRLPEVGESMRKLL
jgi:uncharacterized membrane protein YbhN (UPF0104 family)